MEWRPNAFLLCLYRGSSWLFTVSVIDKPVTNSEEYVDHVYGPGWYGGYKAVDGIYNPMDIPGKTRFYSMVTLLNQALQWMIIDLESKFCVEAVKIWPRGVFNDPSSMSSSYLADTTPSSTLTVWLSYSHIRLSRMHYPVKKNPHLDETRALPFLMRTL